MTLALSEIEAFRRALLARLDALRAASASTTDDRKPVALDQAAVGRLSRMDALQMQAMAQASQGLREAEIARIQAALRRIEEGEFGACVRCGEQIAAKRLAIDPTVPTCVRCAAAVRR